MILALFNTLSQEERVETVQSLVALLAGASPSTGGVPAKKAAKSSAKASAAPAKEKVSRGASDWTQYVMRVRAETGLKMAEAMAEASRRREAGDPDAPPAASAKKASPSSASAAAAAKAPKPKAPSKAPSKKEVAAAAAAAAEAEEESVELVDARSASANADSETVELQEVEVEGVDYLMAPEGASWHKEADGSLGAWAGYLDTETGEFDTSRPAPEGFTVADE